MRRILLAVAALVVLGAGVTVWRLSATTPTAAAPASAPAGATVPITRGDLVDTVTAGGTLGYADRRDLAAGRAGVVTSVPAEGTLIRRGKALYRVDREPVVLMYGTLPLYRDLRHGVKDGPDVRQLERNLRALGHGDGLTVDRHFSLGTARAVRRWQKAAGLPRTGEVTAAQVVFLPGPVRLARARLAVGEKVSAGAAALTVTGTRRTVTVELDVSRREVARKGARVNVELPGGRSVAGEVARVGRVAVRSTAKENALVVRVEIDVPARLAGGFDQAPVVVGFSIRLRRGVLSVPVEALLALREGGYGVELHGPGGRRVVPVTPGAYGGGRVEVSGPGVTEGAQAGVPAR
ncbi:peptidoglycan-binding domain-containing protein [Bailinhaonella thermotolerans]|uniref:Peptidoglycan-binding protein n=1 Tax=Bailinhaonella thermotolerans TaxID=1070861 RepID=A0A3A4B9W6_9ACTN|nr:peptidoglycan-binding domain-containing protein [Bailinhaonella thermotolerans]RJL30988.1 peptidoglycan-binding protein [Bailinhaonella thermotolerans]